MRRPVTLLCLADIHCEKEEFKYFSWLADSLWYYTMQSDNNKWRPDYLIVAGDKSKNVMRFLTISRE